MGLTKLVQRVMALLDSLFRLGTLFLNLDVLFVTKSAVFTECMAAIRMRAVQMQEVSATMTMLLCMMLHLLSVIPLRAPAFPLKRANETAALIGAFPRMFSAVPPMQFQRFYFSFIFPSLYVNHTKLYLTIIFSWSAVPSLPMALSNRRTASVVEAVATPPRGTLAPSTLWIY